MTTHTIDPAKGNRLADMLPTLEKTLAGRDIIELLPGDHGQPVFRKANIGEVTVISRGGVVGRTQVAFGATNWRFAYVPFRGLDWTQGVDDGTRLVDVAPGATGINFLRCSFKAVDDARAWTKADWVSKPPKSMLLHRGAGGYVQESAFENCRNALALAGMSLKADRCTIRKFGNDGIQFAGWDLQIVGCRIEQGMHSASEPDHADGMQGQLAKDGRAGRILIQSNVVDMTGAAGDYLQGITAFDGRWEDVRVLDNVVRCDAFHGVTWFGVDRIELARNTVAGTKTTKPWLGVWADKAGGASTGVVEHDNTAAGGIKIQPTVKGP